jgi:hypothetical protein
MKHQCSYKAKNKTAGTHDPGPLGTDSKWNPENLKDRNKVREWWMVTGRRAWGVFLAF